MNHQSKAVTWEFGHPFPQELLDKINQKTEIWVLHDGWKVLEPKGIYLIATNYEFNNEIAKITLKQDIKAAIIKAQEVGLSNEEILQCLTTN